MHGEWTPHAHLNKDVSEVFVSHQRRRSRKEVRSQGGRSRKKSQFAVPGVFLPGVPAPPGFADVGDSSCADVGDSRPTIYDHPSRYSVATCIVLQCPLLTVPGQSPCAGRCGYLGGFVLGFTAPAPVAHPGITPLRFPHKGVGPRGAPRADSRTIHARLACEAQQEWRRPRPSTFSPPKPLRFNAKDAPRKL